MNVTTLILLVLAVVWAIVLLPEFVRKVASGRHSDTIRSFNHQLSVLDRKGATTPSPSNVIDLRPDERRSAAPRPVPMSVRKRRQEVLTVLGAAVVLTLVCTVAFGGAVFLALHIVAALLLVTYLVLLIQVNQGARHVAAPARGAGVPPVHTATATATATVGRATPAPRRIAN